MNALCVADSSYANEEHQEKPPPGPGGMQWRCGSVGPSGGSRSVFMPVFVWMHVSGAMGLIPGP